MTGFCRDCLRPADAASRRCSVCFSPRILHHPELSELSIAHIDCDAFYAAVEKRDRPELLDQPVIIGGGTRGVVSTACYVARIKGVKSAMPMFTALKLCPEAVVIRPDMKKYATAGKAVRELMLSFTPLVQPISIDEAFLDMTGTAKLHGMSPALSVAKLIQKIHDEVGITASVGLSYNKYLAKLASDFQKPRGFSVIGRAEALDLLAGKSVGLIWGVGKSFQSKLANDGVTLIGQLQKMEKTDLMRRYGSMGIRLFHLARGEDIRAVETNEDTKSVSAETTFNTDVSDYANLEQTLWGLAERVSFRAKNDQLAGVTVTLKLKTDDFKTRSRNTTLGEPTNLAHRIFDAAKPLLRREAKGERFRLIGVGISHLSNATATRDLETLDARALAQTNAEIAVDKLRAKFGKNAVERGLAFKPAHDE
jgi:DNA polymerase IV